jgi:hypothetical protein
VKGIKGYWKATNEMPPILRMPCQGGMVAGPIMAIAILIPFPEWKVNGKPMPYAEVWRSGIAPAMLVLSLLICFGMWGMGARNPAARWLLVAAAIAPLLVQYCIAPTTPDIGLMAASAALSVAIIYGYLFHSPAVKRYLRVGA